MMRALAAASNSEPRGEDRHDQKAAERKGSQETMCMNQDKIQGRMIYTCRLLEEQQGKVEEKDASALDKWYCNVALNGLCGGWVEIFKRDPLWIEAIWKSLAQWRPKGSCKDQGDRDDVHGEDLESLRNLLRAEGLGDAGSEARQVVRALISAWKIMGKLEPTAEYGQAPERLERAAGSSESPVSVTLTEIYADEPNFLPEESATSFTDILVEKTGILDEGPDVHYIAHLETKSHHMAVDLRRQGDKRTLTVCETEEAGIVKCATKKDVLAVLEKGCAVVYDEPDDDVHTLDEGTASDPDFSIKIFSAKALVL